MAEIRINRLLKQFNIGLGDLVEFLHKQGVDVDENPNAKVSDEYLPAIEKQFGKDLEALRQAEKVDIKLNEILVKSGRKPAKEEEEEPVEEIRIKTTTFINRKETAPETQVVEEAGPAPEAVPAEESAPAENVKDEEQSASEENAVQDVEPVIPEEGAVEVAGEPESVIPEEPADTAEDVVEEPQPVAESAPVVVEAAQEAVEETPAPFVEPQPEPAVKAAGTEAVSTPKPSASSFKVVGKVDLSQFERKPVKRERISKGSQKVDVAKAGAGIDRNAGKKEAARQQQLQQSQGKRKRDRGEKFKPAMTEAELEEMQKEIQKQVKETYAKMNEGKKNNFGAKYRKEKRELAAQRTQEEMEQLAAENKVLKVTEFVTVNDLATLMNNTPVVKVIGACMSLGLMVSINQRLDAETLVLVAEEFGYKV